MVLPPGQGGLGLTKVCDMVHRLQAHMLCKVILAARAHTFMGLPTWVDPVIRLFDQATFLMDIISTYFMRQLRPAQVLQCRRRLAAGQLRDLLAFVPICLAYSSTPIGHPHE